MDKRIKINLWQYLSNLVDAKLADTDEGVYGKAVEWIKLNATDYEFIQHDYKYICGEPDSDLLKEISIAIIIGANLGSEDVMAFKLVFGDVKELPDNTPW